MLVDAVTTVGDELERGYTLPAEWYSDPGIYRLEQERIFRRSWQYAGHQDQLGKTSVPGQVDTWGPFVFFNPDAAAGPLSEVLGELPHLVAAAGLDFRALEFRERVEYELAANWKIVVENFLECYHGPVAHPGFSRVIDVDPDSYRLERHEWFSSQMGSLLPSALEQDRQPYDPRGEIRASHFHFLWPSFTLNVVPGPQNMLPLVFQPLDAERTRVVADYFFSEDASEEQARGIIEFGTEVGREDQALVESVHEGLRSGMVERGRLLLSSEHLIQHFQRLVARALA
jgi:choline monooxygenase